MLLINYFLYVVVYFGVIASSLTGILIASSIAFSGSHRRYGPLIPKLAGFIAVSLLSFVLVRLL